MDEPTSRIDRRRLAVAADRRVNVNVPPSGSYAALKRAVAACPLESCVPSSRTTLSSSQQVNSVSILTAARTSSGTSCPGANGSRCLGSTRASTPIWVQIIAGVWYLAIRSASPSTVRFTRLRCRVSSANQAVVSHGYSSTSALKLPHAGPRRSRRRDVADRALDATRLRSDDYKPHDRARRQTRAICAVTQPCPSDARGVAW